MENGRRTELGWSDWALLPAALELILAEIDAGRHEILECGSGASTVAIAGRLAELGEGRVTAIEHDPEWAAEVRHRLEAGRAGSRARIIEAPLDSHPLAPPGCRWYAVSALTELTAGVDLLLVDGPPAGEPGLERSRYPALPALAGTLADDALVILDDIDRAGERWVLDAWERETPYRFERRPDVRLAIGRRGLTARAHAAQTSCAAWAGGSGGSRR